RHCFRSGKSSPRSRASGPCVPKQSLGTRANESHERPGGPRSTRSEGMTRASMHVQELVAVEQHQGCLRPGGPLGGDALSLIGCRLAAEVLLDDCRQELAVLLDLRGARFAAEQQPVSKCDAL